MVDNKTVVIMLVFLARKNLSLYELTVQTKFSIKVIIEQINYLNSFLAKNHLPAIAHSAGRYQLLGDEKEHDKIVSLLEAEQFYLTQEERVCLIYLYSFCRREFVSNVHYQDFLKVSKNTTLSDIKMLRSKLAKRGISLTYTRAKGYSLVGDEMDKHQVAFQMITQLLESPIGFWSLNYILSSWKFALSYEKLEKTVEYFYESFQLSPIQDRLEKSLYFIILILCRYQRSVDRVLQGSPIVSEQLKELTTIIVTNLSQDISLSKPLDQKEKDYITLILSGCFEGEGTKDDDFFEALAKAIVDEMETVSLLNFSNKEELLQGLKRHIIPAYFRLKYGLTGDSGYTQNIKEHYSDLFLLVKKALRPLEEQVGLIPDSEISYFVIHFGGYLRQSGGTQSMSYKALILCPNGVSSSLVIKEKLRGLFPQIHFHRVSKIEQLKLIDNQTYDMVFSTIFVETKKPNYLVSLMMTAEQVQQLKELVISDFPKACLDDFQLDQLIATIKKYAHVHCEEELKLALRTMVKQDIFRKDVRPLLHQLITEETCLISSEQMNWKEAIRLAAKPLLASGKITESYPEAMIEKVEEFGPFINLGKGIAIPHARPEDGVNSVGMSMLVLEQPIYLLDDPKQEIYLLLCIAAIDNETHLKALSHLTTILRDNNNVKALLASRGYQDIEMIIKQED
ncbi:transcription antiterminator BglG [Streptococcus sp. HMSC063D10]|uniref:BglG family transcription antiterminator n=1 Tax=Streptococcus sp. HMSC063D10 TaxID=1715081 RepID=UPI0008A109C3|nr:BglG family transcription antiterminator [Streptococcus sp. HMSC063D10]OFO02527.1 transcription antiterminator BglG [Streptococcus sp. HMSC063D10]